jgi:hypothetical protein
LVAGAGRSEVLDGGLSELLARGAGPVDLFVRDGGLSKF